MAGQESVVPDLTSDNFDLLRFPSLTGFTHELPADNDDLNIMARLGSLFDPSAKATLPSISPLSSIGDTTKPAQQAGQQTLQQIDASIQPLNTPPRAQQPMPFSANSPRYPMLPPRSSVPSAAQMAPRPPMMVCFALQQCTCPHCCNQDIACKFSLQIQPANHIVSSHLGAQSAHV